MNSIEVLRQRQLGGWAPGDEDGNKLYAAVDGGGMAGVVSLGAVHQLGEMGLLEHFDGFAGSSAGSLNAAYGITGQTAAGRDVYVDYLPDNKFMSWLHPFGITICDGDWPLGVLPLPYVDMSVLRSAITKFQPLDTEKLIHDPRELAIGMSNLQAAIPEVSTNHDEEFRDKPEHIVYDLLAASNLPFGLTGFKRGQAHWDSSLFWPNTDSIARERGATHIISLATGSQPKRVTSPVQKFADYAQARYCEYKAGGYYYDGNGAGRNRSYDAARYRDFIKGRYVLDKTIEVEDTTITRIYPSGDKLPGRQTKNKKLLSKGFNAGRSGVVAAIKPVFIEQPATVS